MTKKIIILFMFSFLSFSSFAQWVDCGSFSIGPWGSSTVSFGSDATHLIDGIRTQSDRAWSLDIVVFQVENQESLVNYNNGQDSPVKIVDSMFSARYGTFDMRSYGTNCYLHVWVHFVEASFTLTVNGGITSGSFSSGANCPISPTIPEGKIFTSWTSSNCTLNSDASVPSNSITMPSVDCSVTANFSDAGDYTLTVVGGTGSGDYDAGATPAIAPTIPEGKKFLMWASAYGPNDCTTSAFLTVASNNVVMPNHDCSIVATFADADSEGMIDTDDDVPAINAMSAAVTGAINASTVSIVASLSSLKTSVDLIAIDTASIAGNTDSIKTTISAIYNEMVKATQAGNMSDGTLPEVVINTEDYVIPDNPYALSKTAVLLEQVHGKFDKYFQPEISSSWGGGYALTLPLSDIPYCNFSDYPVNLFSGTVLDTAWEWVRALLLVGVYMTSFIMIIKITRTFEV